MPSHGAGKLKKPWKKGQSGNPHSIGTRGPWGRRRLTEEFMHDLAEDWLENGRDVLIEVRKNHPEVYLQVIGKLMPKQIDARITHGEPTLLEDLPEEVLDGIIERTTRELESRSIAGTLAEGGEGVVVEVGGVLATVDRAGALPSPEGAKVGGASEPQDIAPDDSGATRVR